jgi:hypothetical protein
MVRAEPPSAVSVVLHDVAPSTWGAYVPWIREVDARGGIPLTLLVVPDYHHGGRIEQHPSFRAAIEQRLSRGDEVVVHGYHHLDEAPRGAIPFDWLKRNVYTTGEGELAALPEQAAARLLETAAADIEQLGWPLGGFVPPAWLLSPGARAALRRSPFAWTSTRTHVVRLPDWVRVHTPSLVWSVRNAWRRTLSRRWNDRALARGDRRPLLRLGLHPTDVAYPEVAAWWLRTLDLALQSRRAMTKGAWVRAWV